MGVSIPPLFYRCYMSKQIKYTVISGEPKLKSNKYLRDIGLKSHIDVYDVLVAFSVTNPAIQHAIKKLLCAGLRGHKDMLTDLIEANSAIYRAIDIESERAEPKTEQIKEQ